MKLGALAAISLTLLAGSCMEPGLRFRGIVASTQLSDPRLPHNYKVLITGGTAKCEDAVFAYVGASTDVLRRTPSGLVRVTSDSIQTGQEVAAILDPNAFETSCPKGINSWLIVIER
jgi:hypothetical protein